MSEILEGLDARQHAAVISEAAPLRIIAPAGSGKTRVLTRRIAHQSQIGQITPERTLALTFTRKAASELSTRLRQLGHRDEVTTGTFHAVALAQLRDRWSERGMAEPSLADNRYRLVARVVSRADHGVSAAAATTEIDWAKARLIGPDTYADAARTARRPSAVSGSGPEVMAEIFAQYEDERRAKRLVDFDDLLSLCVREIETDPGWAEVQRWRFRHLFVDEFQDVNPLQFRLLRAWLGPRTDLCVVGDPDQAIYAWNGADATYLIDFEHLFPGAETISLARNYRSTAAILGLASSVLESGRHATPASTEAGVVPTITRYDSDEAEVRGVIRRVLARRGPGRPLSHHAVLARTNGQLAPMAEALEAAGITARIRNRASLAEAPPVQQLLAQMAGNRSSLASLVDELADAAGPLAEVRTLAEEQLAANPVTRVDEFLRWLETSASDSGFNSGGDAVELSTFHAAKGLEWPVVHLIGLEDGFVPISHARSASARSEEQRLLYVAITRARQELYCSWSEQRTFGERTSRRKPSPWLDPMARRVDLLNHTRRSVDPTDHLAATRRKLRGETEPDTVGSTLAETTIDLDALESLSTPDRSTDVPVGSVGSVGSVDADSGPETADSSEQARIVRALVVLEQWRDQAARAARVKPSAVLGDDSLRDIATANPSTIEELTASGSIGALKAHRHGPEILRVLTDNG